MRKILWLLAAVFFIGGIASLFTAEDTPSEPAVRSENGDQEQDAVYTVSSDPIFGDGRRKFVAHRGYSNGAPENTSAAFELAGKSGFWGIETDIQESSDGVFMCMHDETIDRTTDGEGQIKDYTYSELMNFNITSGANAAYYGNLTIPTMIEYLNMCVIYDCVPVIEIKSVRNFDAFLQTIYDSGLKDRCIVTGGIQDLVEIRARNKTIPIMPIGYSNRDYTYYLDLISQFTENRGVLYNYPVVDGQVVARLHESGIYCGVWSLDTAEQAEQYLSYGVDFVVTNEIPSLDHMINTKE